MNLEPLFRVMCVMGDQEVNLQKVNLEPLFLMHWLHTTRRRRWPHRRSVDHRRSCGSSLNRSKRFPSPNNAQLRVCSTRYWPHTSKQPQQPKTTRPAIGGPCAYGRSVSEPDPHSLGLYPTTCLSKAGQSMATPFLKPFPIAINRESSAQI